MTSERELGVEEARKVLGDLVDEAAHDGVTIYITRRGRRVAALIPVGPAGTGLSKRDREFIATKVADDIWNRTAAAAWRALAQGSLESASAAVQRSYDEAQSRADHQ